jgi:hypothetical protein
MTEGMIATLFARFRSAKIPNRTTITLRKPVQRVSPRDFGIVISGWDIAVLSSSNVRVLPQAA